MVLFAIASGAGWLAVAGAGGAATVARSAVPSAASITASVAADGTNATVSDGTWASRKVGAGRYQLAFDHDVHLVLQSWDALAVVTVEPFSDDLWLITFVAEDAPVDSAFTFRAAPLP